MCSFTKIKYYNAVACASDLCQVKFISEKVDEIFFYQRFAVHFSATLFFLGQEVIFEEGFLDAQKYLHD